jgi:hypothetical protein
MPELIVNGGFETAGVVGERVFAAWYETNWGAIIDETASVHGGGHAAKLVAGLVGTQTYLVQWPDVIQGTAYTLTFWTRGDGVNAGWYEVQDDANGYSITSILSTMVIGTDYQLVSVSFTTPVGCTAIDIYLGSPSIEGGIAYFDDVSLLPSSEVGGGDGGGGDEVLPTLPGFGTLYVAPLGTMFPLITEAPSTDWIPVGDTEGGTKLTINQKIVSFSDLQYTAPSIMVRTEESGIFETRLVNPTLETLAQLNGLSVLAGASVKRLGLYRGSTVVPMALLCRLYSPDSLWPRQYA